MRITAVHRGLLIAVFSVVLSACGTNPYSLPRVETADPTYEKPETQPPAVPAESSGASTSPGSPAHSGLMARAAEASGRGDYDQALAYLERAQRIEPDNAAIYLALARTHEAAGNGSQARSIAERGLLYCSGSGQCDALKALAR